MSKFLLGCEIHPFGKKIKLYLNCGKVKITYPKFFSLIELKLVMYHAWELMIWVDNLEIR